MWHKIAYNSMILKIYKVLLNYKLQAIALEG